MTPSSAASVSIVDTTARMRRTELRERPSCCFVISKVLIVPHVKATMSHRGGTHSLTFLALWAARSRTPIADGHAYLFRTATNLAINHNRRQRILSFVDDPDTALATLADETPSAEQVLLSRQELMIVYATLKEFPPAHRAVFILSRIDGRTFAEIGRMLDIQPRTAFGHMVRILARMKLRLDEARR